MGKINQAVDLIVVARLNTDAPVPLFEGNLLAHQQGAPRQRLTDDSRLLNHLGKDLCGAIKDRNLEVVDVNVDVVHAQTAQRRKQMLDG